MPRRLAAASAAALIAMVLSACTSAAVTAPDATAPTPTATPATSGGPRFPTCAEVAAAIGPIAGGLTYSAEVSAAQTAAEDYEQRVCVYTTADSVTQLGVTIAAIPFQQAEIDSYATLPNAIADDRLAAYSGVIQTLTAGDGDDGSLDSALYLFDTSYSVTIQGVSTASPISVNLPALSVPAAIDAAFAVRALVN
jgi:hypothetical protein